MMRSIETPIYSFGDDEYQQRIDRFNLRSIEQAQKIPRKVLISPRGYWSILKYLAITIIDIVLSHYIAVLVLNLSVTAFVYSIAVLSGIESIITMVYSAVFFAVSVLCLVLEKGSISYELESSKLSEHQKLLQPSNSQNRQSAGYGSKDETKWEEVMTPRPDVKHSDSHVPLNYSDEGVAGPSHASGPYPPGLYVYRSTGQSESISFIKTNTEDGYDSDEPTQGPFEARISVDAINFFGPPLQVFGADSYRVLMHSSDEECSYNEPINVRTKKLIVPVDVHLPDSYTPCNPINKASSSIEPASESDIKPEVNHSDSCMPCKPRNDDSSSDEPAVVVPTESAMVVGYDAHSDDELHYDLPYMDDDQS